MPRTWRFLCRIPCLDECALCAIRGLLGTQLFDSNARAVFRKDDVLFLHFAHAALGKFVGVEVDL